MPRALPVHQLADLRRGLTPFLFTAGKEKLCFVFTSQPLQCVDDGRTGTHNAPSELVKSLYVCTKSSTIRCSSPRSSKGRPFASIPGAMLLFSACLVPGGLAHNSSLVEAGFQEHPVEPRAQLPLTDGMCNVLTPRLLFLPS